MTVGSTPSARIISSTLREVEHFGLCQMTGFILAILFSSRPRRATDVDTMAVAAGHFRIDPAHDQDAAVEGDDFAILRSAGRIISGADVILAAARALQRQLLLLALVGQIHQQS